MSATNLTAYKYAVASVFLWSTVATAFKLSLNYLSPQELVLYASFFSLIVLFVTLKIQKKLHLVTRHIKNHIFLTIVLGVINPFLYYLILFAAYALLPAQEAQAINYTWALMLAFLSVFFLKQKLYAKDIFAGIICYFGVLIIATKGDIFALEFSNLKGVFLALLSTVFWSFYWIFSTKIKADSVVVLFSNFLVATPLIVLYFIFTQPLEIPDIRGILGALYIGIFEMGITFILWLKAMQYTTSSSKIANLIFISPFLSLIFIHLFVKEPIFDSTVVGLVFILSGLFLQQKKKKIVNKS